MKAMPESSNTIQHVSGKDLIEQSPVPLLIVAPGTTEEEFRVPYEVLINNAKDPENICLLQLESARFYSTTKL